MKKSRRAQSPNEDRAIGPLVVSKTHTPYRAFEAARYAMGDRLRYARKMDLIKVEPRGDLSSTGYALVNPGKEYLVLQTAESDGTCTVNLEAGSYTVEWFNINDRELKEGQEVTRDNPGLEAFVSPFEVDAPSVLYLKRIAT